MTLILTVYFQKMKRRYHEEEKQTLDAKNNINEVKTSSQTSAGI